MQHLSLGCSGVNPSSGFDYEFNSIEDPTNELFCAYKEMFELAVSQNKNLLRQLLAIYFPIINVVFVSEPRDVDSEFHSYRNNPARPGS